LERCARGLASHPRTRACPLGGIVRLSLYSDASVPFSLGLISAP
jgi:hypothetical protein